MNYSFLIKILNITFHMFDFRFRWNLSFQAWNEWCLDVTCKIQVAQKIENLDAGHCGCRADFGGPCRGSSMLLHVPEGVPPAHAACKASCAAGCSAGVFMLQAFNTHVHMISDLRNISLSKWWNISSLCSELTVCDSDARGFFSNLKFRMIF